MRAQKSGHFRFLNVEMDLVGDSRWDPAGAPLPWKYHLHYFRYLAAMAAPEALALMLDWIGNHRSPRGTGWEPYPLSIRDREWIEWLVAHPDVPGADREQILASLGVQTEALAQQLEYHLLGNHLLENGITLAWAGLSLVGPRSTSWLAKGIEILEAELPRQVLADGTHDERSPMYQALIAEALGRLALVAGDSEQARRERVCELAAGSTKALLDSLAHLTHPDGCYALLNDCVLDGAPRLEQLRGGAAPPPEAQASAESGAWALPDAGYFGARRGGSYLVFDAGPLGPDHQPGHGHADALSFELSHGGRRLVTDTGVFTYEQGDVRAADRGTAAHSTIEVDGADQSDLWAAFRCGRRIRIAESSVASDDDSVVLTGAYRGPGGPVPRVEHRRELRFSPHALSATDVLRAAGVHRATARLHLAPGIRVTRQDGALRLHDGVAPIAELWSRDVAWSESRSPYHPDFGVEVERVCLEAPLEWRGTAEVRWELALR